MTSANLFIIEFIALVMHAANGLYAATRGWKWLALFSASSVVACAWLLWHWTVTL